MVRIISACLITVFFIFGCEKNLKIVIPEDVGGLLYKNSFENESETIDGGTYTLKKDIHERSLIFKTKDSSFTRFKKEITLNKSFTLSFWFRPEFYGRNGTIITLSKDIMDFPLESTLSLYMNKNRIAAMHEGSDLRKVDYKNKNTFTTYFMSLKELNVSETYFLTYIHNNNTVNILIDGEPYAEYENVPRLTSFNYITLGASWNKQGGKYYFNGAIDDLYMFNRALNNEDVFNIMNYTHVYQYAK